MNLRTVRLELANELVDRVWRALQLSRDERMALGFADAAEWQRWSELQHRRWRSRVRGSIGLWFLRRKLPFHPFARPRVARAYALIARLDAEIPRFWLHHAPPFADRVRVSEAMEVLRRAETRLRREGDEPALAICLELEALLWRGSLDNGFEAQACEKESAELTDAAGWFTRAAIERLRGELWEAWWQAEVVETNPRHVRATSG